ncbi:MAG TPA: DUF6807 family protein [Caulobacteraceae bacterium]
MRLLVMMLMGLALGAGGAAARPGLDASLGADGVTVLEDGKPVLFYRTRSANPGAQPGRLNYIHPLYAPDGTVLTEDAPADHPNQRGLFWAWDRVLVKGRPVADGWFMQGLTFLVRKTRFEGLADGSAVLTIDADWIGHSGPELLFLAAEETKVHVFKLSGTLRRLDFDTTITPKVDGLALAGSPDFKGYGGFTMRLIDPQALSFASDGRAVRPAAGPVSAGSSMGFAWSKEGPAWGVGLSCKANGAPLTRWILRREASMQNCVFPGARPYPLVKETPLRLQASLVIEPTRR